MTDRQGYEPERSVPEHHDVPEAAPDESEAVVEEEPDYGPALARIRTRRKFFFGVILIYVPAMWLIHSVRPDNRTMFTAFGIWVVLLLITCVFSAICKCPRCGNLYHVNGMAMLYLRRCLHCQLHIVADKGK